MSRGPCFLGWYFFPRPLSCMQPNVREYPRVVVAQVNRELIRARTDIVDARPPSCRSTWSSVPRRVPLRWLSANPSKWPLRPWGTTRWERSQLLGGSRDQTRKRNQKSRLPKKESLHRAKARAIVGRCRHTFVRRVWLKAHKAFFRCV